MLDFKSLVFKYGIPPKGVIQIGCHFFQEKTVFQSLGIENYVLVEPQKEAFAVAKVASSDLPNVKMFNCALSDKKGELEMNCDSVNEGQSSSILEPLLHTTQYPSIKFDRKEVVKVKTLDSLDFDRDLFNIIVIDVQGAELMVLKGGFDTLANIDVIYSEINFIEMYKGCVLVKQLDEYLEDFGFKRVETGLDNGGWSDALYVKESFIKNAKDYDKEFNEQSYLANNPDVATAIGNGIFGSGLDHYNKFGKNEGRKF
jgi:FkbM family methyltransferase